MTDTRIPSATPNRPLRLWPGVAIVGLQWILWLVIPKLAPGSQAAFIGMMGGLACGLLVVIWWLFFSRAPWLERLGAVILMVGAMALTRPFLDASVATAGMGFLFYLYAIPWLSLTLVLWAVATRRLPNRTRRLSMIVTIALTCGMWTLLRTEGISGVGADFAWRWSKTPEERLLARADTTPPSGTVAPNDLDVAPEWPGFRGPGRDSVIRGLAIDTDWQTSPPIELWRRPIGPGWSSFAVQGDFLFTQEQRGDDELVSCYQRSTGEPIWRHGDSVRFWEANAGAGPRATPTLSNGRVFSLGATGILNVLDATDGAVIWTRDVASDTATEIPYWGFSSSPLVIDDLVVVAAAGQLAAFDVATGEPGWFGPKGGDGYSSPQLMTIDGVPQIVLLGSTGVTAVAPTTGSVLWRHSWSGYPIVQPNRTANGDLLITADQSSGIRRLAVERSADDWTTAERWTSIRLKPYFNDFVVHEGHAYGFDGTLLACIGLDDGERRWKGGRYGQGQIVLLADEDLLLVLSEQGDLALVEASPAGFHELARFRALEGKTWNHPVLIDDTLLVRNDREMAAFRLALRSG